MKKYLKYALIAGAVVLVFHLYNMSRVAAAAA